MNDCKVLFGDGCTILITAFKGVSTLELRLFAYSKKVAEVLHERY